MEPTTKNSMNMRMFAVIGILIVILVIVGYLIMTPSTQTSMPEDTAVKSTVSEKRTFTQLLAMSGGQKCSFVQTSDLSRSSGTFYTVNGKGRGDLENTVISGVGLGTTTISHMITDGVQMLAWDNDTKQGVRISMAELSEAKTNLGGSSAAQSAWDQSYVYDCAKWNVDDTIFLPPADIEFLDLNEMMKGIPSGMMETGPLAPLGK